jgi:hypothetical protein
MNWLKLAPYIVAALVLAGGIAWHASKVRQADRAGYARAMDEVRRERDTEKALNEHKREAAARDYQSNIDSLQARVDALSAHPPVVRLCKPSADSVRISKTAGSADAATDTGSTVQAGADIGGPLVLYGRDCESTRRQLTALQGWIRSLD